MKNNAKSEQNPSGMYIKKAKIQLILGVLAILAGFAVLVCGSSREDQGRALSKPMVIFVFLGCSITSVVLMLQSYAAILPLEMKKIIGKLEDCQLASLHPMSKDEMQRQLLLNKFKYKNSGYYKRRKLLLFRGLVSYFVRIVDSASLEDTAVREKNQFDATRIGIISCCFILVVYMDELNETDRQSLKKIGRNNIAEDVERDGRYHTTDIVVAADKTTQTGYFLDVGKKYRFREYACGCRLLKSLFC